MRDCSLTTESRTEECGIVTQVAKCAPRVCGDDPLLVGFMGNYVEVLPAYAGMILFRQAINRVLTLCSPRMRG